MAAPPPPPPPPPGMAPPSMAPAKSAPSSSKARDALLSDIRGGARLKPAVTNDRSGPFIENKGNGGSRAPVSNGPLKPQLNTSAAPRSFIDEIKMRPTGLRNMESRTPGANVRPRFPAPSDQRIRPKPPVQNKPQYPSVPQNGYPKPHQSNGSVGHLNHRQSYEQEPDDYCSSPVVSVSESIKKFHQQGNVPGLAVGGGRGGRDSTYSPADVGGTGKKAPPPLPHKAPSAKPFVQSGTMTVGRRAASPSSRPSLASQPMGTIPRAISNENIAPPLPPPRDAPSRPSASGARPRLPAPVMRPAAQKPAVAPPPPPSSSKPSLSPPQPVISNKLNGANPPGVILRNQSQPMMQDLDQPPPAPVRGSSMRPMSQQLAQAGTFERRFQFLDLWDLPQPEQFQGLPKTCSRGQPTVRKPQAPMPPY